MSRWDHEYRSLDPNTRESVNDLVNAIFRAKTGFGGRIDAASQPQYAAQWIEIRDQVLANRHKFADWLRQAAAVLRDFAQAIHIYNLLDSTPAWIQTARGEIGTHAAAGNYEPVAEALLKEMNLDAYFMEYDDARSGDFKPLRYLAPGKTVVLGLVTTKFGEMEDKDELKRRIDEAAKYASLDQLALSPQCGFSSTVHGNNIAVEAQRSKLRLVVETAQEVWGSA